MNISDEIKRLHELHQAGALTDAEFELAKAKLLKASVELNKPSPHPDGGIGNDVSQFVSQLRRSRSDRWLGGVCGGLAKYTGTESWIWRLLFVVFTLTFGFAVLAYVLLWIFVPEE